MKFGIRETIFMVVVLGLMASSYFLVFRKANAKREAMQAEIDRKQKALADLSRATDGIDDVKTRIQDLQNAITFFESKLPHEREIDQILKQVSELAQGNALQPDQVKTLKSQKAAGYSEQPIEIGLTGDFQKFYAFMLQ